MWHVGPDSWWMTLLMLGFWGVVIWIVIRAGLESRDRKSGSRSEHPTALDVLAERYARGEIDDDEYLRRRATLEES